MPVFGTYPSNPKPYALNGQPGWYSVPAGRNWFQVVDAGQQIWVSPNPITVTSGVATGFPLYAAELNIDGTLVFQSQFTSRALNIDSPPRDRLSQQS